MPSTDSDAYDAQDGAEVFDEDATTGDQDLSDAMDIRSNVLDVTAAAGDADLEGDDDEMDAADETDADLEEIAEISDQQDADDLDDENSEYDPLAADDIPDSTTDRDFADEDDVDGVSARPDDEPATVSMADVDRLGGERGERVADFESDSLSDSDLAELDYKQEA